MSFPTDFYQTDGSFPAFDNAQTDSVQLTASHKFDSGFALKLIAGYRHVDTSTALTGVFNTNNPRSAATVDGSSFYVSGQGVTADGTGGVFYAPLGATTATAINANTTSPKGTPNFVASRTSSRRRPSAAPKNSSLCPSP